MSRLSVSLLALLIAMPAAAQDGGETDVLLDEIVVTANREATRLSETGASVKIVTQEDLRASGDAGLAGYFRRLSGFTVNTRGTIGTQAGLLIRGASQNYLGATIDGIDVTDPSNTQVAFDFGQLTTAGIGRVEVLKGSQSALYGAGAVGGVVSIETLRPTKDGLHQEISAEAGSFNTASLTYSLAFRNASTELAATLSHVQTDGFSNAAESEGNTEADGFKNDRLSFYAARVLDNGAKLGVNGFVEQSESDYDPAFYMPASSIGLPNVPASDQISLGDGATSDEVLTRNSLGLRAFYETSTGAVDHKASLSAFRIRRDYYENEALGFGYNIANPIDFTDDFYTSVVETVVETGYIGTRLKADYQAGFDGLGGRVVLGFDALSERLQQSGYFGSADNSTQRLGLFGEYSTTLASGAEVAVSGRVDNHSLFGTLPTMRVAVLQPVFGDTVLRMQAGTGYRAPSNFELYSAFGATSLQAEHSSSADIGLETTTQNGSVLRGTVFFLAVDNLIDYDFNSTICPAAQGPTGQPGCYDQVAGTSIRRGVELEAELNLGDDLIMDIAYTYTDSQTNASTAWAQIPRHQVALGFSGSLSDTITGRVDLVSAFNRPNWDDGSAAPDFTVVNATISHDFRNGTEAYLRFENLTDEDYQLVQHYGTSGRAVYAGIRASF
jgi:vitamin B12 transporter